MFFNEAATLQFLQKVKLIIATTKNMKEYEILNQFIENEYTVESLYL